MCSAVLQTLQSKQLINSTCFMSTYIHITFNYRNCWARLRLQHTQFIYLLKRKEGLVIGKSELEVCAYNTQNIISDIYKYIYIYIKHYCKSSINRIKADFHHHHITCITTQNLFCCLLLSIIYPPCTIHFFFQCFLLPWIFLNLKWKA